MSLPTTLAPARRRGVEILDDRSIDPALRARSLGDIVVSNRLLGGTRAALRALAAILDELPPEATLLDVGTGLSDIPACARALAARRGVTLVAIGVDEALSLLHESGSPLDAAVCADARALPFRDGAVDVVLASQVLHHFEHGEAVRLLRELDRVARRSVVIADLRRSWIAVVGFRLAAWALRFHPITRHDGVASVLRGFTSHELGAMIEEAVGARADVRRWLGYRLTASWRSRASHARPE